MEILAFAAFGLATGVLSSIGFTAYNRRASKAGRPAELNPNGIVWMALSWALLNALRACFSDNHREQQWEGVAAMLLVAAGAAIGCSLVQVRRNQEAIRRKRKR